ncbi:hypothetical protein BFJ63_vAg9701 [Fusarium oxysporum f. sp. narcissi]|uniref:Uncharacterized protein n=2 Tax=Fusarium oxysporum TaxID=5507 RepID=A0A4Q2VLS8_FUSOX|nr:hypothetical protein FOZG_00162 [Fusarium oxysporum Fo47]EWZ89346.1 hypothetical protein FOWG_09050 [Fusarium oxysporum f. sp. lycopersici MN25]KAJ4112272.1 hypothetical protein NW765_015341 [Fusarium oxysporum]RKL29052.1 hypothetical protein BFJ70_g10764 [Fusarium oxysporum]RYC87392.1 hypothetical protein BFJ63_vAg9701 [Fusarium oxysporum f. sp. narcissi]
MARKNNRKSRRSARSKPTKRIFWSTNDRLQLLAYLNWCVQYCVKFEVTAPGYLEKVTGKHFSKERIRQKLYQEWQTYGTCKKFNELFELGTAGLWPLVGEEQENFNKIITSMKPAQEARCTRSRSLGLAAQSGTMSAPRSIYSISSSREPNQVPTPQAGNSNVVPERPRQKTKAKSSLGPTRMASNNDLSEDELIRDNNTDRVKSEDESELSTIASPELLDIELQLAPAIPDSQEDTMTVISHARSNSSMDVRLSQSEVDLLKQKSYSVTLENRISELKRRNDDLEHCISLASSAQGNHGEETRLREVISSLKNKLDREQILTKNYRELEADRLGFLNTSLRAEYGNMHSNIRDTSSMICHLSLDDTLPEQRTGFAHLANNWARRIGGHDLGSLLGHCESEQIPKRFILASLLSAGIFELVLEEVFPAFLAADSPLLDQYRKHIETQSGRNALQRLDVISIKSLVSDKDVKKGIISERSNRLSSLMLQNLSCFLPLESRDITQRSPHNELETETISDMRSTLHHALNVKIELMLSVKRLKYLFFRPGTLFDAGKMEVVKSQAGDTALLGQEVKICLLPALFTIPEAGNETGVEEESSFKANYSKALAEVTDEDLESLVLVEKAIVFL